MWIKFQDVDFINTFANYWPLEPIQVALTLLESRLIFVSILVLFGGFSKSSAPSFGKSKLRISAFILLWERNKPSDVWELKFPKSCDISYCLPSILSPEP